MLVSCIESEAVCEATEKTEEEAILVLFVWRRESTERNEMTNTMRSSESERMKQWATDRQVPTMILSTTMFYHFLIINKKK
jgi:hypothetical protein